MNTLVSAMLIVVAVVHLLPLAGVLGDRRLAALYGVRPGDANLSLLLRHRAVLFGLLGGLMLTAAFDPALAGLGLVAAWASLLSFILLAARTGGINAQLARVVAVDLGALACTLVGTVAHGWPRLQLAAA